MEDNKLIDLHKVAGLFREIQTEEFAKEEAKHSTYKEINVSGWTVRIQEDLMNDNLYKKRALTEALHKVKITLSRKLLVFCEYLPLLASIQQLF